MIYFNRTLDFVWTETASQDCISNGFKIEYCRHFTQNTSIRLNTFAIHAHFYQPPREDPLTGIIPVEPSAAPYPNWNERIHSECYRPNAELRNFEQISFNIGPTLFNWMVKFDPITCQKIIEQDATNHRRYGFGNAIAQAYNHTILPLGSYQDKLTQIYWGISDFTHRFNRKPVGMWLPETAVDYETLTILSQLGIQFTILAPWQADVADIDPTQPYRVKLPDHHEISVFFYQRDLSSRISFDPISTINADTFAREILQSYYNPEKTRRGKPQMLLIASDGELYGHHQMLREYFLARLVDGASHGLDLTPTFPALWLKDHPPQESIRIQDNTSWSCHHGVLRWMGRCACTPGEAEWKIQMRYAFERLGSDLDRLYQDTTRPFFKDPWQLRNQYIHVLLGQMRTDTLISELANKSMTSDEIRIIHLLLEAQRERQRMFTSCGWFFEDFDRIEPRNNVAYAAQAVRLVRLATDIDLEPQTLADLRRVKSQLTSLNAADVFERHLRKAEGVNEVRIGYAD